MASNGSPMAMSPNGDDERPLKRTKLSPTPFKQPHLPNRAPQEERTDINDLNDLMNTAGVDLKDEEDILTVSFQRRPSRKRPRESGQQPDQTNFDLLSQRQQFPSIGQHHGVLGSSAVLSQEEQEDEIEDLHAQAARAINESSTQHLNSPFLWGNTMRYRMENVATGCAVKMPMNGLFDRLPTKMEQQSVAARASIPSDKGPAIVAAKAPSILHKDAPLEPILTLMSLATQDRVRGLLENAWTHAYNRQTTTDGQVLPEWEGLAKIPENTKDPNQSVNAVLNRVTTSQRKAEAHRLKKRAARNARRAREAKNARTMAADGSATPVAGNGTPGANGTGTPGGTLGVTAPEPQAKMSKKELDKMKKADSVNNEIATRNANVAVSMALGGGKKYAWMTGGTKKNAAPARPAAASTASSSNVKGSDAASSKEEKEAESKTGKDGLPKPSFDRQFGTMREDGEQGRHVQLRDWIHALETDGREDKALSWILMRQYGKEKSFAKT